MSLSFNCFGVGIGCPETLFKDVFSLLETCFNPLLKRVGLIRGPNHMIYAKDLTIHDPKHKQCWELKIDPKQKRFKETKLLKPDSQLWEIKASISFDRLLADKTYGVHLIFKTTDDSQGLDAVLTATVSTEIGGEPKDVCLSLNREADADQMSGDIKLPVQSSIYEDWMELELELGEFFCSNIYAKREAEISIKVKESGKHHMGEFYVAGIELRPKTF